jgi:hypothetical protein
LVGAGVLAAQVGCAPLYGRGATPAPIRRAGDFPPPAAAKTPRQRLAECASAKEPQCFPAFTRPTLAGVPTTCLYGWSVGAGHPASDADPPGYDKMLNVLDQCAWFHDRGAWSYNPVTKVCETWVMCSNSVGLQRCLDRVVPKTPAESAAKACFSSFFEPILKTCVVTLYKDWGAQLATDKHGEQWLSPQSIGELRTAMRNCPSPMHHPGFLGL